MTRIEFPPDFIWGTATASYQIEGAVREDGRGESIWDRFSHTPAAISDGSTGDVACDHYHRWREDVALLKAMNTKAYRFSIAWPRVFPEGRGSLNPEGVDFYNRLVDSLLEAGIEPYVTLYHWDLPQALQDHGGWADRGTVEAFVEYADVVSRALGDRVKNWTTMNEPWCISILSHALGQHAPGLRDWNTALRVAHHVLLAHGQAVPVLRRNSPQADVAITLNFEWAQSASTAPADYDAMRIYDGFYNRWFLDPVFGRGYPADMVEHYTTHGALPDGMDFVRPGDLAVIAAPIDWLGVNYYTRALVKGGADDILPERDVAGMTRPRTDFDWEIAPDGLYNLLCRLHFDYQVPRMMVTENGASFHDGPDAQGKVDDQRRIAYLRDHFAAARRAMDAGVPLTGYFVWSALDNFEWAAGYKERFGLIHVDFATQKRTPKASSHWFRDVIASGSVQTATT